MLDRWIKTVKKLNSTSCYIPMPKSEEGREYIVMTKSELKLILERKLD